MVGCRLVELVNPPRGRVIALDLRAGQRIDHHSLLEPLGEGGQGSVWKVLDPRDGGVVRALKLVSLAETGPASLERARREARIRVHERGAGETLACGTGACAAVVAGIRLGWLDRRVDVQARGGVLTIEWPADDASVLMTGPAETVYEGEIEL